ncbi:MAG TPA: hypothetical protein VEY33_10065 [Gemmatimonadota bacterium]|nr:hypothetical protein [Gemmatimonadota bacterium]
MSSVHSVSAQERALIEAAVARMRAGILAIVFAMMGGTGLFVATAWLLIKGGQNVGATLGLLGNYLPGYAVSWPGAIVGLAYGAAIGGVMGWSLARIYNRLARGRSSQA